MTAWTAQDAIDLVKEFFRNELHREPPTIAHMLEDVDLTDYQGINPPNWRGIWYPRTSIS